MRTIKLLTIVVLIMLVAFAYGSASIAFKNFKLSDSKNAYLGGLTWYKSLKEGLEIAQEQNKPVLVYFWAIWCQFCEKFETETLPQPEITKMLTEDYVLVAIDLDEDRETPNKFGVRNPPFELFLDMNGNVIDAIPGFVSAENFLPVVKEVRDKYRGK